MRQILVDFLAEYIATLLVINIKEKKYCLNNRIIQEEQKIISELYSLVLRKRKIVSWFFFGLFTSFVFGMIVHIVGARVMPRKIGLMPWDGVQLILI